MITIAKLFTTIKKQTKYEITGISLISLALLFLFSFFLVPLKSPISSSKLGAMGVLIVKVCGGITGSGRFLLPIIMIVIGYTIIREKSPNLIKQKIAGMLVLFMCCLTFLHITIDLSDFNSYMAIGFQGNGGGLLGALLSWLLIKGFGKIGSIIILTAFSVTSLLLVTQTSLVEVFKKVIFNTGIGLKNLKIRIFNFIFEEESEPGIEDNFNHNGKKGIPVNFVQNLETPFEEDGPNNQQKPLLPRPLEIISVPEKTKDEPETSLTPFSEDTIISDHNTYQLPPIGLLQSEPRTKNPRINKDITENIHILEDTLESFGVKVKVTHVSCGPTVTRYEMQPCPGVKVSKIVNLADDIALNMASSGVRIEAPVPGKSVVGIEVPKKEVSKVCFREVLESSQFTQSVSKLTVALGQDITGNSVVANLASMPHLLIAGATGSGKSVCMNTLICSILYKAKPSDVKFLMIDPKMVELTNYNGLPHLVSPVITSSKKAAGALKWAVYEMEKRYNIFASTGVKDIHRYNELKSNSGEELPQIVILIDELADLMMVAPGDVEDSICRLAQMARAAGMHLVVATQRPSVDVITGLIKANIPSRIAFAVSSQIDSRTILDMAGAEKLLGRGDMLFNPVGASKPVRVQGVFLSEEEIGSIVSYCKAQAKPEYFDSILVHADNQTEEKEEKEDELFLEAAKLVIDTGQASISHLQRRFRIGYSRAARLMDSMENKGIVGGYEGSKPRKVLVSIDQLEKIQNSSNL
ncbi:MAG: DNA translocase FtsK 4TM domain-containing protein [Bacillota bacterium]